MALSTVACAVIIRICGRSLSGVVATNSRMRSRPLNSGIMLSTMSTSKVRSPRAVAPGAGSPSRPRRGRRREARDRAPSGFFLRRLPGESSRGGSCRWSALSVAGALALDLGEGELDHELRAVARDAGHDDRSAEPFDDVLGDRQAEPRTPRFVVKYGSKICIRSVAVIPGPRSATMMRRLPPAAAVFNITAGPLFWRQAPARVRR